MDVRVGQIYRFQERWLEYVSMIFDDKLYYTFIDIKANKTDHSYCGTEVFNQSVIQCNDILLSDIFCE